MLHTLLVSAVLMGLAGSPHCVAMCGPACAAMGGAGRSVPWAFHLGRLLSYSLAGAVVAASVGSLAALGQAVAALRPLWTLVHVAALGLGLLLLWQGRQPEWMERIGRVRAPSAPVGAQAAASGAGRSEGWQPLRLMARPARQTGIGLAWVAWPCGLLQSALLVASLANGPVQGAVVMAGFGLSSALGLTLGPALWWRLARRQGPDRQRPGASWLDATAAVRLAGAALALASAWALGHGLWVSFIVWCGW